MRQDGGGRSENTSRHGDRNRLGVFESNPGLALVESEMAIERGSGGATAIARAKWGVLRLALAVAIPIRDTGGESAPDDLAMEYTRVAGWSFRAGSAICPGPTNGPRRYGPLHSHASSRPSPRGAGPPGKLCLETTQIAVINATIRPRESDFCHLGSRPFLADFEARGRVGAGRKRPAPPRPAQKIVGSPRRSESIPSDSRVPRRGERAPKGFEP